MTSSGCGCAAVAAIGVIDMGDTADTVDHFDRLKERGDPYWWLYAARCAVCKTNWLVGQEERQNDVIVIRRLAADELSEIMAGSNWPPDFDQYETLLRIGRAAGHTVRWVDPINDSSIAWTIADLARQRPGIRAAELASLLDLDEETTAIIVDKVIRDHGVSIQLDSEPWK
jgi:hypothetical protein